MQNGFSLRYKLLHNPEKRYCMAIFIKFFKSEIAKELQGDMVANHLLNIIAYRISNTGNPMKGIKSGEALMGDYQNYDMTRQQYRSGLNRLKKWKIVTTKTTNKGTIVKLCDSTVYGVMNTNAQPTEQPDSNHYKRTKNKEKNNIGQKTIESKFDSFWDSYDLKQKKALARKEWEKISDADKAAIFKFIPLYIESTEKKYRTQPHKFLKNRGWEDEIINRNSAKVKTEITHKYDLPKFENLRSKEVYFRNRLLIYKDVLVRSNKLKEGEFNQFYRPLMDKSKSETACMQLESKFPILNSLKTSK